MTCWRTESEKPVFWNGRRVNSGGSCRSKNLQQPFFAYHKQAEGMVMKDAGGATEELKAASQTYRIQTFWQNGTGKRTMQ